MVGAVAETDDSDECELLPPGDAAPSKMTIIRPLPPQLGGGGSPAVSGVDSDAGAVTRGVCPDDHSFGTAIRPAARGPRPSAENGAGSPPPRPALLGESRQGERSGRDAKKVGSTSRLPGAQAPASPSPGRR